jgi:hypothetical protein
VNNKENGKKYCMALLARTCLKPEPVAPLAPLSIFSPVAATRSGKHMLCSIFIFSPPMFGELIDDHLSPVEALKIGAV